MFSLLSWKQLLLPLLRIRTLADWKDDADQLQGTAATALCSSWLSWPWDLLGWRHTCSKQCFCFKA